METKQKMLRRNVLNTENRRKKPKKYWKREEKENKNPSKITWQFQTHVAREEQRAEQSSTEPHCVWNGNVNVFVLGVEMPTLLIWNSTHWEKKCFVILRAIPWRVISVVHEIKFCSEFRPHRSDFFVSVLPLNELKYKVHWLKNLFPVKFFKIIKICYKFFAWSKSSWEIGKNQRKKTHTSFYERW